MNFSKQRHGNEFSGVRNQCLRTVLFLVQELRLALQVVLVCSLGIGGVGHYLGSVEIPNQRERLETVKKNNGGAFQGSAQLPRSAETNGGIGDLTGDIQ